MEGPDPKTVRRKRIFAYCFFFFCIGLGSLLMYNFYSDNTHVIEMAERVACEGVSEPPKKEKPPQAEASAAMGKGQAEGEAVQKGGVARKGEAVRKGGVARKGEAARDAGVELDGGVEGEAEAKSSSEGEGDSDGCKPHMTMMSKSPYAQNFEFQIRDDIIAISCTREHVLVGPFSCVRP